MYLCANLFTLCACLLPVCLWMLEKTLKLLTEGSRHAANCTAAILAPVSVQCNGCETQMHTLPSTQLRISCNGKLVLSSCYDSRHVDKLQTSYNNG